VSTALSALHVDHVKLGFVQFLYLNLFHIFLDLMLFVMIGYTFYAVDLLVVITLFQL